MVIYLYLVILDMLLVISYHHHIMARDSRGSYRTIHSLRAWSVVSIRGVGQAQVLRLSHQLRAPGSAT